MISILFLYKINLIIHGVYTTYSISAANKQIEELKNLLQSKSTLFEELSSKNAELDNQLKSKSTLFDEVSAKNAELDKALEEVNAKNAELDKELKSMQKE